MQISFRQGIVRGKMVLSSGSTTSNPTLLFIQPNSSGTSVDLFASQQEPTVITFAHYGADYLAEETASVTSAWGGGVQQVPGAASDINNSSLSVSGVQNLYWDIDLATGSLRRGWTAQPVIVSGAEPVNPVDDLHWFDLVNTRMRVWRVSGGSGHWLDKIRVFAGVYTSTGTVTPWIPSIIGSQVGIQNGQFSAGNLLLGSNGRPLRQSDGTFLTTETELVAQQTSGQNVKFDTAVVYAQAAEDMAKFSLVSFQSDGRIALASSLNVTSFVAGMVVESLYANSVGQIISNGAIRNEQWSWSPTAIGKPLFCDPTGQLTLAPPPVGVVQQVGFVFDVDAIYLNLFPPVRL